MLSFHACLFDIDRRVLRYAWFGSFSAFDAFENPDIRNHPRISPRIFDIIRKFWGRVGCEKIDVRWGTIQNQYQNPGASLKAKLTPGKQ